MTHDALVWPSMLLGILLAVPSLPGTIELLLLTLGGILPPRREDGADHAVPIERIAVLVPAHDEAEGIAQTVASLRACDSGDAGFEVVVIADNCTDNTAELARSAGARVLERRDPQRRGKGFALDFAFRSLLKEPFDGFIVVDADTRVELNLVTELRRLMRRGAAAIQCCYRLDNPEHSLRARLRGIAWMAFNVLRLRGRERWRLSVGLLGNGFGLTRETLLEEPYEATSVVEDMEYHLRLVAAGRRVVFAPNTGVWSDAPYTREAGAGQRARWEGGRFRMVLDWTPVLLRRVMSGEHRLIEPLLELLLLPLAFHVLLLLVALLPPFEPTRTYAFLGLALVAVHVLAAIRIGGGGWRDLLALATAPFYILWKLTILRAIGRASRNDAAWVRTERNEAEQKD
ncbi:glycosyltransferase family 2 protein [Thiocapsa bogorovii]|uniref:glycosyltransferase family 2 protein n=1 Tax=Thiocapsa bogorovii TaxID=521689 RepID=UPI001E4302C3|nr:glycosyltransferase family 2 protein [Thiocapsa bogorovii]UHD18712.1 glycosyltransferase family 2 protein [Thiocapsa bogorovii]